MRCLVAKALSGTVVEALHDECDVFGCDGIESHFLGEELTDQPVHVFVCTALPRSVWVREKEISIQCTGNPFMLGELFAVIGGQCVNAGCKRSEHSDHGVRHSLRCFVGDMGDQGVPRGALVHGHQGMLMGGTNHQVSLPVTKTPTLAHYAGAQVDRHLVGYGAAAFAPTVAFLADLLTTQSSMQRTAGRLVGVNAPVDAFMADTRLAIDLEVATDLLGTPGLSKFGLDHGPRLGCNARAVLTGQHA